MKDFLTQYSAMRFALDRQDRRRRGQHGVVVSLLLAFGYLLIAMVMLPAVVVRLLREAGNDLQRASADPTYQGRFFNGRPPA